MFVSCLLVFFLLRTAHACLQAVQLVQKQRQAEEEANAQGAGSQAEPSEAVAAALAGRPQRRLWEDIYTISYSRYSNSQSSSGPHQECVHSSVACSFHLLADHALVHRAKTAAYLMQKACQSCVVQSSKVQLINLACVTSTLCVQV